MMVLKAFWGSLEVTFGALGGVLEALWVVLGVCWDPFGDLRSTKKFVFELLMASVDLDVLFFFSCLLFCSCLISFGAVIFLNVQDVLTYPKLFSLDVLTFRASTAQILASKVKDCTVCTTPFVH